MEKSTYLTFVLGDDLFAVNVVNVLEVLEQQQITRVPKEPEHILGIINFRGDILPVINTRQMFNLDFQEVSLKCYIIVFDFLKNDTHYPVAATVDGVRDVIEVRDDEIKPVPEIGLSYDSRFIAGIIRRDEKFILLIHSEKVFSTFNLEVVAHDEIINQ